MSDIELLVRTLPPLWLLPLLVGWGLSRAGVDWGTRWWIGHLVLGEIGLVAHALGMPRIVAEISTGGLVVLAAAKWFRVRRDPAQPHAARVACEPDGGRMAAIAILLAVWTLNAVEVLAQPAQDWDTLAIWFNKARAIQAWLPLVEVPLPNYPNLGPVLEANVLDWIGRPQAEPFARLVFPTQYFFWCVHLVSLAPARCRRLVPLALALLGWLGSDVAFRNGYQDGFVALCGGLAVSQFWLAWRGAAGADEAGADAAPSLRFRLGLAGWLAGSACLVKNEGAVLAGMVLLGCTLAWTGRPGNAPGSRWERLRPLVPLWAALLGMACVWPLLCAWNGLDPRRVQGGAFTLAGVATAYRNLDRLPEIGSHFAESLRVHADLLFASIGLGGFAAWRDPGCRRPLALLAGMLIAHSLFVGLVFVSTQDSYQWHLENAFHRLMFQHVFVYPLALATAGLSWARGGRCHAE